MRYPQEKLEFSKKSPTRAMLFALLAGCGSTVSNTTAVASPDASTTDSSNSTDTNESAQSLCQFRLETVQNFGGNQLRPDVINVGTYQTYVYLWPDNQYCESWIQQMLNERGQIPAGGDRPVATTNAEITFDAHTSNPIILRRTFDVVGNEHYKPIFAINAGDLVHLASIPAGFTGSRQIEIRFPDTPFQQGPRVNLVYDLTAPVLSNIVLIANNNTLQTQFDTTEPGIWSLTLQDSNGTDPFPAIAQHICTALESQYLLTTGCPSGTFCTLSRNSGVCRPQVLGGQVFSGDRHTTRLTFPSLPTGQLTGTLQFTDLGGNTVFAETVPIIR